ncbi:unnamed protein product [Brachionus calyciflorus]|uniref:Oxidation resistance protein 1 n=1 Tax=Brachionus calyciflorus TaxID=104777 RepID=A0A813M2G2_9BILA|nr:unnamed protein product [Brachionus calyciflorus]
MSFLFETQINDGLTTSSRMASAFVSASEKASKSILTSFSPKSTNSMPNSPAMSAEKKSFALLRGLSKPKHSESESPPDSKQSSNSLLSDSLAAASSALNNFINLENNENHNLENNQRQKQNLFFQKLEAHSLSLSSALFGNEIIEKYEKMSSLNNNRSNSESADPTPLTNISSIIKKKHKPPGTIEYKVEFDDTIEKIALKWNTIPSEIQHLNRLVTRVIFPGQIIFVPDPNYIPPPLPSSPPEKAKLPDSIIQELNTLEEHKNLNNHTSTQKNTSQGFNIFKWKTTPAPKPGHVELQKQKCLSEPRTNSQTSVNSKKNQLVSRHTLTEEEAKKLDEECMQRFLKVNCKIVTRSKGCFEGVLIITPTALMFDPFDPDELNNKNKRRDSSVFKNSIYDEASAIIPIEIISNVIMYEDLALKDVQEYFDYQHHIDMIENNDEEESKDSNGVNFNLNESLEDTIHFENSKLNEETKDEEVFENDIGKQEKSRTLSKPESNDDKSSVMSSSTNSSSLISCYLCIKVNKNKDFFDCPMNRKMKNRLTSEFWFQIIDTSTDKICAFFLEWKSDNTYSLTDKKVPKSRFQLVKQDEKLADLIYENILLKNSSQSNLKKNFSTTNRLINKGIDSFVKDWEVVNLKELEMKIKQEIEIEKEYKTLPTLTQQSIILKDEHLRKLNANLIPRAVGYDWILSFSTELHGFSLGTMYRQLSEVEGPCLIVVLDSNQNIFGAMSSCKLYPSEHYYGTGESFLFSFTPSFKVYKWTGENNFFIRGNSEGLGFGCAEGYHGLWFDGDLLNGHSQRSKTYDNDQLSSTEEFLITAMEIWSFSD